MNKKLGIGIVVIAIVSVAMFVGCIEKETAVSTPSPSPTPTPIPEPKYSPGDVVRGNNQITQAYYILDYNESNDWYKFTTVKKFNKVWIHVLDSPYEWNYRSYIEETLEAVKIDHVNSLTIPDLEDLICLKLAISSASARSARDFSDYYTVYVGGFVINEENYVVKDVNVIAHLRPEEGGDIYLGSEKIGDLHSGEKKKFSIFNDVNILDLWESTIRIQAKGAQGKASKVYIVKPSLR